MKQLYYKNPNVAAGLTLCFPGLGQIYVQQSRKAIGFILIFAVGIIGKSSIGEMNSYIILAMAYLLAGYDAYKTAQKTSKHTKLKKDPHFAMCLSLLYDGAGQLYISQTKKGMIMAVFGLTSCIISWIVAIKIFTLSTLVTSSKGTPFFVANVLITWIIVGVGVKVVSIIDAFYGVYHLYVIKKDKKQNKA